MPLPASSVRRSLLLFAAALALLAAWAAADWYSAQPPAVLKTASYVGRQSCIQCHAAEAAAWHGSHHDRAMEVANDETVLGDFNNATFDRLGVETRFFRDGDRYMVHTEGPDGQFHDYEIKYTFGIAPLQQYMVEFPDGRIQVLRESWDVERGEWFFVTPDDVRDSRIEPGDPLHWTSLGQNWNTMCAVCHTTDYHKNYDLASDTYDSTYAEIDVSCETCHGPGSVHVELAEERSLFWDRNIGYGLTNSMKTVSNRRQIETCAPCHSRRAQIHPDYHAGESYFDHFDVQLLEQGLYHADGQILDEVYVYGSFLQSNMYHQNVRCTDCHDPHSLQLKFPGNQLCAQCHQPGKYDTPNHHRHVAAADGAPETQCVSCHMPGRTYMNIDFRRDHSFRVPRPDLSAAVGTPNACNDCHVKPEEDAAWAAEAVRQWYGDKRPDDPRWARAIDAGRRAEPLADAALRVVINNQTMPAIVRATAIGLLAYYPEPANRQLLTRALDDDSPLVRAAAASALPLPPPSEIGLEGQRAEAAARAWGQTRDQFFARLAPLLRDKARSVQFAAANRIVAAGGDLDRYEFRDQLRQVLAEYRRGLQMDLDRVESHMSLATLARGLGNLPEAVAEMRLAIEREPYRTGPRSMLVELLQATSGASDEINRLLREEADNLLRDQTIVPGNPYQHFERGRLLYLLGDWDEARAEFITACRLGPQDYMSWEFLALLCEKQERWHEATFALQRMHQLQPDNPDAANIFQRMAARLAELAAEQNAGEPSDQDATAENEDASPQIRVPPPSDDERAEIEQLKKIIAAPDAGAAEPEPTDADESP